MRFLLLALVASCASPPTPTTIVGADCVTHRTALQLACIDRYDSGPAIDACRAQVQAANDCTRPTDGGTK